MTIYNIFAGIAKHINPLPNWGRGAMRAIVLIGMGLLVLTASAATRPDISTMSGGQVLNCFGWKYKTITAYVDTIKNHGFTAVQVTTVQPIAAASALEPSEGNFTYRFNDQDNTPIKEWYRIYMPLDLRVITDADNANGNAPLGTFTEFQKMITACHEKGIAVIVGIEANQVAATGYDSSLGSCVRSVYNASYWNGSGAWTSSGTDTNGEPTGSGNPFTDPTRKAFTMKSINPAVLDLKTESKTVIDKVKTLITTLYSDGVDGIYWYHAKYIGLKYGQTYSSTSYDMPAKTNYTYGNEGSDFWPTVWQEMNTIVYDSAWNSTEAKPIFTDTVASVTPKMFSYVNLNLDPYCKGEKFTINSNNIPAIDHDPAYFRDDMSTLMTNDADNYYRPVREYTKYGRVVDAWFGKSSAYQDGLTWPNGYFTTLQSTPQFYNGWTAADLSGFYAAEPSDMVYRVEDEDTYFNNPEVMYEPMSPNNIIHENRTTNTDMSTYYKNSDNKVPTLASIDRGYADMCGHNDVTTVYFARPFTTKKTYTFGDDVGDIKPYYCYYEDTRDWAKSGKTLTAKYTTGDTEKTTTDGFVKIGENNGHEVYMWMTDDEIKDAAEIHFTDGHDATTADEARVNITLPLQFHKQSLYDISGEELKFAAVTDANRPTAGDPTDDKITVYVCITNPLAFPVKTGGDIGETVKKDNEEITHPYLYYTDSNWNDIGGGGWPGTEFTQTCQDKLGRTWYYMQVPANTGNIIPNNGIPDGVDETKYKRQTGDITGLGTLLKDKKLKCVYYRWDGITNKANYAEGSVPQELPDVVSHPTALRFTNSVVTQANILHQKLRGERESKTAQYNHDNTGANIGSICRRDGAILIMRDPSNHAIQHTITNSDGKLTAGTYKDHVSGNEFNVDGNSITGTIGSTGVAVLYNDAQTATSVVNIEPEDGSISPGNITVKATRTSAADANKTLQVLVSNNLAFVDYTDYIEGSNANGNAKSANMRCKRMTLTDGNPQSVDINYYKTTETTQASSNIDWGLWGVGSTPIYVRVMYDGEKVGEDLAYSLLNNANTSQQGGITLPSHMLFFHFSDDLKPEQFSIYAWDQEGDKEVPLLKTGTYLAKEQLNSDGTANETAYVRPIKGLYKMVTTSGVRTVLRPRRRRIPYNNNYDGAYLHAMGVDKDSKFVGHLNGVLQIKKENFDSINNTPYSLSKGTSFNDVVEIGGMKISRFTVGIPNVVFQNIKVKLTYHSPQGFTQEMPTLDVNDDAFYDIQLDKLTNNCNIGRMYVMGGTAIYDNAQWKYYNNAEGTDTPSTSIDLTPDSKQSTVSSGVFWKGDAGNNKYAHATFLSYDAAKSQEMSKGQIAEVFTYTGEFVHGGTMRFGSPFDFQTNFVEETDEEKIPSDASDYKVYLKPVVAMYGGYVWEAYGTTTRMARGRWCPDNNGSFTVPSGTLTDFVANTRTKGAATYKDITWKLPSGRYTLTFYHLKKDTTDTYYYTVSHPVYTTESASGKAKVDSPDKKTISNVALKLAKDADGNALSYDYRGETDDNSGYYREEIDHVGAAGHIGTDIKLDSISGDGSYTYSLEGKVTDNQNRTTYRSLYPETGKYRIIYRQAHLDKDGANTTGLTGSSNTYTRAATKSDGSAWNDKKDDYHFLLGFDAINYNTIKTINGTKYEAPTGFWKSYSDGLPRLKPHGVTAYYVSGYLIDKSTYKCSALYITELKGDTLPGNTGLLLHYTRDTSGENAVPSDNLTINGNNMDNSTLWLEAAEGSEGVRHQAGKNYLRPWIATDNDADEEWAQHPNNRQESEGCANKIFGGNGNHEFSFGGLSRNYGKNYELRLAYVSIPKEEVDEKGSSGDVVFNAKPRMSKETVNNLVSVQTAPVDYVIGDDQGALTTGIRNMRIESDEDDAPIYNLSGQRVSNPHHGVFIRNGKKIILK